MFLHGPGERVRLPPIFHGGRDPVPGRMRRLLLNVCRSSCFKTTRERGGFNWRQKTKSNPSEYPNNYSGAAGKFLVFNMLTRERPVHCVPPSLIWTCRFFVALLGCILLSLSCYGTDLRNVRIYLPWQPLLHPPARKTRVTHSSWMHLLYFSLCTRKFLANPPTKRRARRKSGPSSGSAASPSPAVTRCHKPRLKLLIPDTLVFNVEDEPQWYYTDKVRLDKK